MNSCLVRMKNKVQEEKNSICCPLLANSECVLQVCTPLKLRMTPIILNAVEVCHSCYRIVKSSFTSFAIIGPHDCALGTLTHRLVCTVLRW